MTAALTRFALLAVLALLASGTSATDGPRPLDLAKEAVQLLGRAASAGAAGDRSEFSRLLKESAQRIEDLARQAAIAATDRKELQRAVAELRDRAKAPPAGFSADATLRLLDRVGAHLRVTSPLGLDFQGSYSETKVEEPAYGGHASAMGPPPVQAPSEHAIGPSPVQFEEVPGLDQKAYCGGSTKDHILESGGSGLALLDYDGDGLLDVYVVSAFELDQKRERIPHRNALYHNLGGWKFENVAAAAGVDAAVWGNGVCAGDYDADGRIDLYVTNYGPNHLYRNKGDGTFTDEASAAGVHAGSWSTGCAFFDADADEDLDLYVARYVDATWDDVEKAERTMKWRGSPKVMLGPVGLPGGSDIFYENRGDGSFVEATRARGLADAARAYGFGVLATDYDDDGRTDLFVANDSNPNFLYHNLGHDSFESVGLLAGVALNAEGRAQAGMGVDAGDYDGDGRMDLVVTNFAHDTNTLRRNIGEGQFEDVTQAAGLAGPTFVRMGWGTAFFDADLDGRLDLFFANGHIYPQVEDFPELQETFGQRNQLFLNDGGRFTDVSETAGGGLQVRKSSRGLAVGDLDNDGDLDLAISNMDDVPTLLENRQRTGHHWVGLRLRKPGPNAFCIGARVSVDAGGRRQIREVRSGGSYLSQSDLRPHFGLGGSAGPVDVEVRLGASRWRFNNLAADRYTTLVLREEDRVKD